ncbi:cell division protein CrgA [Protofrankia symbiont of Coriaria ruscifolia]|uniref:cell division protein CrgA n=1 Tax=Protofrankia symbiont of Coriaria ruscifolia TaxID=1306542 RepID=UPI0010412926|nr:cell division protein CrgA [Protofrankia symbiont of Coriaria ruscifolia]
MPVSRRRKKKSTSAPPQTAQVRKRKPPSPPWMGALILTLFLIGITWLLVYYFSNGDIPGMDSLGAWNILIGFGFVVAGLGVSTQWR